MMSPADARSKTNLFGKLVVQKEKLKHPTADLKWDRVQVNTRFFIFHICLDLINKHLVFQMNVS